MLRSPRSSGAFDVVVANIGRAALVELAPELVQRASPAADGLAVSGFSPSQGSLVAGFLRPLVELERRTSGEWSALVLTRSRLRHSTGSGGALSLHPVFRSTKLTVGFEV